MQNVYATIEWCMKQNVIAKDICATTSVKHETKSEYTGSNEFVFLSMQQQSNSIVNILQSEYTIQSGCDMNTVY